MCFGLLCCGIESAVCCGLESLCALCCCCAGRACCGRSGKGESSRNHKEELRIGYAVAKWFYLIGFALTAIATWVLRDYTGDWLTRHIGAFSSCQDAGALEASCTGKQIALRVSFANFSFFFLHLLATLGLSSQADVRASVHAFGWFWKLLLWVGALVGFFFVPDKAVYGYAQAARVGSGLFLVVQLLLLIGFVYEVNELLTVRWEQWWARALLVIGTAVGVGLALALIGISYHYYAPSASCHLNIFFITWTLIMGLMAIALLFIPDKAASAGLMTSGFIWLYCAYVMHSALASEPGGYSCIRGNGTSYGWITVVAFFIALFSVLYATIVAGAGSNDLFGKPPGGTGTGIDASVEEPLPYRADFFHLVFALGSMYIAMLFANWAVSTNVSGNFQLDTGWASTWVKMASVWACEVMYLWSIVAPALLPGRDFSAV